MRDLRLRALRSAAARPVTHASAVALLACTACAGLTRPADADLALELVSEPVLARRTDLELALRNRTDRELVVARPTSAFLLVSGTDGEGQVLRCETPPPPPEEVELVPLRPGEVLPFRVDPYSRCTVEADQEVRFVVRYAAPPEVRSRPGGARVWTGATGPAIAQILPRAGR